MARALLLVGLSAAALTAAPMPAQADTSEAKLRCVEAYEQSQRDRRDGRLMEARTQLLACSQEACPEVVRNDCTTWLGEVLKAIPSVVVSAKSSSGEDLLDARVLVDDRPLARELSGQAFEMNPGRHRIRVEVDGYPPFDQTVMVVEGQKLRAIVATLEQPKGPGRTPPPPPPAKMVPPSPAPAVVFGAVGIAGFGGLTYFGLEARASERALRDCRPCSQREIDATKRDYVLANVSLGLGIAGATGTLVWVLTAKPHPAESSRHLQLDFGPSSEGAGVTLRGRF